MTRITKMKRKTFEEPTGFIPFQVQSTTFLISPISSPTTEQAQTQPLNDEIHNQNEHKTTENNEKKPRRRFKKDMQQTLNRNSINPLQQQTGETETTSRRVRDKDARKNRRTLEKQQQMMCFLCRTMGHSIKDCPTALQNDPNALDPELVSGIETKCYKCGKTDHTAMRCKKKVVGDVKFPFAVCFVCGGKGHLAIKCEKNNKGVYPDGGSCDYCGSVEHFKRDCKPTKKKDGTIELGYVDSKQGAEDDDVFYALSKMQKGENSGKPVTKRVKRSVKF